MKLFSVAFLLLASVSPLVTAFTAADFASLPSCALQCFAEILPTSACTLANSTCVCTNVDLNDQVTLCVASNCTIREALTTKNGTETACGAPVRDRSGEVLYVAIVGGALAIFVVLLRMLTKLPMLGLGGTLGWDDAWMLFSTAIAIPYFILNVDLARNGLGHDIWTIAFDKINYILKIYYVEEALYLSLPPLIKTSILFFYLRIFPDRGFRRATYSIMILNLTAGFILLVIIIFQCSPVPFAWNGWDGTEKGSCGNTNAQGWATAGVNMAFDIAVTILPLKELYKLHLSLKKKFQLIAMFSVGLFITVISAIRIDSFATFANTQNKPYDYVPLAYWSMLEVEVALICACMPSLRSLYVGLTRGKQLSDAKGYHSELSGAYYGNNSSKGPNISVTEKGGVPAYSAGQPSSYAMRKPGFVNPTNGGFIELHDMDKDSAGPATPHAISDMRSHVRSPVMKSRAEITTSEVEVERRGEGILQTRRVEITSEPVHVDERNGRQW